MPLTNVALLAFLYLFVAPVIGAVVCHVRDNLNRSTR